MQAIIVHTVVELQESKYQWQCVLEYNSLLFQSCGHQCSLCFAQMIAMTLASFRSPTVHNYVLVLLPA